MRRVRLGDFLEVQAGFAFKTEYFTSGEGMPLIRIRDLDQSQTVINYSGEYKPDFLVNRGDYLIGMDGNFRCYRWQGETSLLNQRVCRLRSFQEGIEPEYVFYGIQSKLQEIENNTSFVTVKHLSAKQVQNIEMPLPPLPEQRRIVDLLSRAEGIVRLRREAEKKAAELIPALFLDMFGDPAANPKGWPVATIGSFASVQTGATPSRENLAYYTDATIPWVKTGEVDGSTILATDEQISELALSETNCKLFPVGTILVAMYGQGQTRGRSAVLGIQAATNQACAAILPSEKVETAFLFVFLKTQYEQLRGMAHGGNQANLNLSMIKGLPVILPPITAQRVFSERLDEISSIQVQQSTATAKAQATFDALLAQVFS